MSAVGALLREPDSERSCSQVSCLARSSFLLLIVWASGGRAATDVREVFGKIPRRPDPDKPCLDPFGGLESYGKSMNIVHSREGLAQLRHAETRLFSCIQE